MIEKVKLQLLAAVPILSVQLLQFFWFYYINLLMAELGVHCNCFLLTQLFVFWAVFWAVQ